MHMHTLLLLLVLLLVLYIVLLLVLLPFSQDYDLVSHTTYVVCYFYPQVQEPTV